MTRTGLAWCCQAFRVTVGSFNLTFQNWNLTKGTEASLTRWDRPAPAGLPDASSGLTVGSCC